jgi:phosphoserine phosphatase
MNYCFDIDGTISEAQPAYAAMIAALLASGHECHILTGTMDAEATEGHYARRTEQLLSMGISEWTRLHIVTSPGNVEQKAQYCRENNIVFMFEDSPVYADAIREVTTCVLMCPR